MFKSCPVMQQFKFSVLYGKMFCVEKVVIVSMFLHESLVSNTIYHAFIHIAVGNLFYCVIVSVERKRMVYIVITF